jgi:hypothetical protein
MKIERMNLRTVVRAIHELDLLSQARELTLLERIRRNALVARMGVIVTQRVARMRAEGHPMA